ncbi:MAG: phosphatase PAP2 family protein [Anaeromyxobacter sp.]
MSRALALLIALLPAAAAAQGHALRGDDDLTSDYVITGSALAFTGTTELLKSELAPVTCRWCNPGPLDTAARNALLSGSPLRAQRASDVLAISMVPASAAYALLAGHGQGGSWEEGGKNVLYVAEATAVATSVTQLVKYAVGRQRPFAHADPSRPHDPDDNLSFFSGHSSLAFSLVAATGTVAQLRGYEGAPWVWGVGLTAAAGVGYLRIAGDKHYLTDVLVGAAVGTAAGIAVPRLLHPRASSGGTASGATVTVLPVGIAFSF